MHIAVFAGCQWDLGAEDRLTAGAGSKVARLFWLSLHFRACPCTMNLPSNYITGGRLGSLRSSGGLDWKNAIRNTVAVKWGSTISSSLWGGAEKVIALGSTAQFRVQVFYQKWQPELGSSGVSLIEFYLAVYCCCGVTTQTLPGMNHCPGDWSPPLIQGVTSKSAHLIWDKENASWESGQCHVMLGMNLGSVCKCQS